MGKAARENEANDLPRAARPRQELLRELRAQLGRSATVLMERVAAETAEAEESPAFSSGAATIDRLLPGGGLRHGILIEWLAERPGCGAGTLGLLAAREACRAGGLLVVVDRTGMFYPPAAAGWGVDPARLIVVRPRNARDEIWAAVQSLRSPVVAALWTMVDRLDSRNFRRLQLAAETGGTLGVLVRGASARGQPSWADVRLGVKAGLRIADCGLWIERANPQSEIRNPKSSPRRLLQVSLLHVRGGRSGGSVCVEIDEAAHEVREARTLATHHDSHPLPVVTELANPASGPRPARA
ncbi:MAG: ImuA family protein [Pirellulales bacterium]